MAEKLAREISAYLLIFVIITLIDLFSGNGFVYSAGILYLFFLSLQFVLTMYVWFIKGEDKDVQI